MKKLFKNKPALYLVGLIAVPFIWYLAANLINGSNAYTFAMAIVFAGILAALLLLVWKLPKGKLKEILEENEKHPKAAYYIITVVIMLLLPLGGLSINQGFTGFGGDNGTAGLFGDFSHPLFYIIAVINGILMLLHPAGNLRLRFLLFFLKAAGYTYILYFLVVFIPMLPLGAVGIIFYGLGIFIWAPLAASVWQGIHLYKEWAALSRTWGHKRIAAAFAAGLLTLPICMAGVFWGDKANFYAAAEYLKGQNYEDLQPISLTRLKRTLVNMKGDLQPTRGLMGFNNGNTPIISDLYSRFVLDGRVVSQNNIMALENLFLDAGHDLSAISISDSALVNNRVYLKDVSSNTVYDEDNNIYRTWVHLRLVNAAPVSNGEYVAAFRLPEGVYISDYYLDVSGERKMGILADRRAALFTYSRIVNTRKDPGLLHYIGDNTVELRVFPFFEKEERTTGFEIIHSRGFDLKIDNLEVPIGKELPPLDLKLDGAVLLGPEDKSKLKSVEREPNYYFVVDCSKSSDTEWLISQIEAYAGLNGIEDAKVLFADYRVKVHNLADMHEADIKADHGFNLNLAVRKILDEESSDSWPVIIVVTDNMPGAVFPREIHPLSDKYPESRYYYLLNHNLTLTPYTYGDNRAQSPVKAPIVSTVLDYNGTIVPAGDEPELVVTGSIPYDYKATGSQYNNAVLLEVLYKKSLTGGGPDSLELIRSSFRSRILTPLTAFIVVETPQQEKELLDVQEQILNSSFEPALVTLDEPPLLACALAALAVLWVACAGKRKRMRTISSPALR